MVIAGMNWGMSSCLTRISLVSGLTASTWPCSWYAFTSGARLHEAAKAIAASRRHAHRCIVTILSDSLPVHPMANDFAFEMAASAVRFGAGVTREGGAGPAELG